VSKSVETLQSRHFLSLLIRPDVTLLGCMDRIASQQQPQRRFSVTRDVEDDGCGLNRIAGLGAVMFPLLSCDRADNGIVLRPPLADLCRRVCKIGAQGAHSMIIL
jgi:hypothetical protein